MTNTEPLVASAPEIINVPLAESADAEAAFTYQRADGTMERAVSAEDAIARCPVLGKLAMEAPEQANVLLELAATGKEKMKAQEEQYAPKPKEQAEAKQSLNPKKPGQPVELELEKEPSLPKEDVVHQVASATEIMNKVHDVAPAEKAERVTTAQLPIQHQQITKAAEQLPQPQQPSKQPKPFIEERALVEPETAILPDKKTELIPFTEIKPETPELNDTSEQTLTPVKSLREPFEQPGLDESPVPVTSEPTDDEEPTTATEEHPNQKHELKETLLPAIEYKVDVAIVPVEIEGSTDNELAIQFEPEIIEVYQELANITKAYKVESLILDEPISDPVLPPLEFRAENIPVLVEDFKSFFDEPPDSLETTTLETIQEQAQNKPLEQTLVDFAELLAYSEQPSQPNELRITLRNIATVLPTCYIIGEAKEPRPRITLEMTEQLLILLRGLGYEHPREVLVGFVQKYSLSFLLQALRYLCLLNNLAEQHEFFKFSISYTTSSDDRLILNIGKLVFGFLAKSTFGSAK